MTEDELKAVERRYTPGNAECVFAPFPVRNDVIALIAEVRRLRAEQNTPVSNVKAMLNGEIVTKVTFTCVRCLGPMVVEALPRGGARTHCPRCDVCDHEYDASACRKCGARTPRSIKS